MYSNDPHVYSARHVQVATIRELRAFPRQWAETNESGTIFLSVRSCVTGQFIMGRCVYAAVTCCAALVTSIAMEPRGARFVVT